MSSWDAEVQHDDLTFCAATVVGLHLFRGTVLELQSCILYFFLVSSVELLSRGVPELRSQWSDLWNSASYPGARRRVISFWVVNCKEAENWSVALMIARHEDPAINLMLKHLSPSRLGPLELCSPLPDERLVSCNLVSDIHRRRRGFTMRVERSKLAMQKILLAFDIGTGVYVEMETKE